MTIRYQALWMALVYKTDLITIHGTHGIFRIQAHIWAVAASWAREGNGTPLQYSCLENPTDAGAWWAAVHGVAKSWTWLSNFTFTFHFYSLEKEMATHSSVLAWRSPGMGSHRDGHNWSDLAAVASWAAHLLLRASFVVWIKRREDNWHCWPPNLDSESKWISKQSFWASAFYRMNLRK